MDGLTGHVLVGRAGSLLGLRIAHEGAVVVARAILENALWLGDGASTGVGRACAGSVTLWGAE